MEAGSLEREGETAADGAGGLDEIDGLAVGSNERDIPLGEEIAQVHHCLDLHRKEAKAWKRLAHIDVQVWIRLARRAIEHVDRGEHVAIGPAVGGAPVCLAARNT